MGSVIKPIMDSELKKRLGVLVGVLTIVLTVFVGIKALGEFRNLVVGPDTPPVATITVTGDGEASAAPNIADLYISVSAEAKAVKPAQDEAAAAANKVVAYLKQAGVAEPDIKTTNYSLNPQYDFRSFPCTESSCPPNQRRLTGYEVRQTLQITVRKLSRVGEILAGIGDLGVTDIGGPNFRIDREDNLRAAARTQAIAEAKNQARQLASELGVSLGRLVQFSEGGAFPIFAREAFGVGGAAETKVAPPPVPAGENMITSQVTLVYEIR